MRRETSANNVPTLPHRKFAQLAHSTQPFVVDMRTSIEFECRQRCEQRHPFVRYAKGFVEFQMAQVSHQREGNNCSVRECIVCTSLVLIDTQIEFLEFAPLREYAIAVDTG